MAVEIAARLMVCLRRKGARTPARDGGAVLLLWFRSHGLGYRVRGIPITGAYQWLAAW
jgi:hypothetical protein